MPSNFKLSNHIPTILIFVGSFGLLCFSPFLGSVVGLEVVFPNTFMGWMLFLVLNVSSAIFNSLIFYSFLRRGKEQAYKTAEYKQARQLLRDNGLTNEEILSSPQDWEKKEWKRKMIWIAIGTVLGSIVLTQAVLAFDVVRFISQALVLIMGLVFGALEEEAALDKYSLHYLDYAEQRVRFLLKEVKEKKAALLKELEVEEELSPLDLLTIEEKKLEALLSHSINNNKGENK